MSMSRSSVKSKAPVVQMFALAALAVAVFSLSGTTAQARRPARGSVNFGAQSAPGVNLPPSVQAFSSVFADVAEAVIPAVVSIIPTKIDTVTFTNNPFYQQFPDFFQFFGPFGGQQQRRPQQPPQVQRQERRQQGLGSGVIVSRDGYILTNSHVVSGASEIEVKMADGRSFGAEVVGADTLSDVAVIKIKERVNNLPVAYLGDSDKLRPGEWALAIGNPFSVDLASSVTMGIVSAVGRAAPLPGVSASYQDFIQTDAAINPGNSGGALVNIKGELIGINTMIMTRSGGNMGIGFAIPINMARRVMEDLIYDGKVSRGWLGVSIQELDQATRDAFGLAPETKGVLVGDVFKDQPADRAGIKRGDVITKINGKATETVNQLRNQVAAVRPGQAVPIEYLRNGKRHSARVTVTSRDEGAQTASSGGSSAENQAAQPDGTGLLGMTVGALTQELREQLNIPKNVQGVVITDVGRGQAAQEGLRNGDIIMEVNRKPTPSMNDYSQAVKGIKAGDSALFLVQREGNTFFRAVRVR